MNAMEMKDMNFCQSCGMPMESEVMYGTEANGSKSKDYCQYCYDKGAFTADVDMQGMIDQCAPHMVTEERTEDEARAMMAGFFPTLKRWR